MSCQHREDAGAWVLGALPDDERERFAAHLAGCEICSQEIVELQMVADTLPLAAPQMAPPPELKERIMAAVRAEAAVLAAAGPEADVAPIPAGEPATAEPVQAPAERPRREQPERRRRESGWWRRPLLNLRPLPAAAAAAVLIAVGVGAGAVL
jgi:anti-sigma factor RsiW